MTLQTHRFVLNIKTYTLHKSQAGIEYKNTTNARKTHRLVLKIETKQTGN